MTERIDWNEASKRGLIERINTEVLHPIGLAMFREVETGLSPGLLISEDGAWEYAKGTSTKEQLQQARKMLKEARKIMLASPSVRAMHKDYLQSSADFIRKTNK